MSTEEDLFLNHLRTRYPKLTFIETFDEDRELVVNQQDYDDRLIYLVRFRKRAPLSILKLIKESGIAADIQFIICGYKVSFVSNSLKTGVEKHSRALDNWFARDLKNPESRVCPICCDDNVSDLFYCVSCGKGVCRYCYDKIGFKNQLYGVNNKNVYLESCKECPFCRMDISTGEPIQEIDEKIDYKSV